MRELKNDNDDGDDDDDEDEGADKERKKQSTAIKRREGEREVRMGKRKFNKRDFYFFLINSKTLNKKLNAWFGLCTDN